MYHHMQTINVKMQRKGQSDLKKTTKCTYNAGIATANGPEIIRYVHLIEGNRD